ncbi:P44/Msp2 family outer membrane protein [Neoehrlichia mikurensis]|uniref:P44/Msp2 family outer membrane protein n=1 Tax=Neoehrlichia mikurensis TaxID=89586 RepID=A0A9Q9F5N3_9RICK|nr:P44/Msp2 family outer membrane protein [Neoehrlichia mikurensis]UTO55776.1 P44/Msp2 family outer membrane protein [Neoehrlichia mikurensis]UTO56692.1 P44/Msp2 family outer membrane protein [Neoehrlichia mikurensis]
MNYKKVFNGILVTLAIFIPKISFAYQDIYNNVFYISASYNPTLSRIKNFTITEPDNLTKKVFGYTKDMNSISIVHNNFNVSNKKFHFSNNLIFAFSGAAGYIIPSWKRVRIEFEVSYEKFNHIADETYSHKNAHKFCALSREDTITDKKFVVVRIDAITDVSLMLNTCLDSKPKSYNTLIPYICAGIGSSITNIIQDHLTPKFAYKIKAGINYSLTSEMLISIGGFYHGTLNKEYNHLPVLQHVELDSAPYVTNANANASISYFGGEIGVRFIL